MQALITLVSSELSSFLSASDKREHLITRAEKLFDQIVEPIDLPGPDRLVDPILRSAIRPLVSRLRHKLDKFPALSERVVSVRGTGYLYEAEK